MTRSEFAKIHILHAIEEWDKVIDIQTQVFVNERLKLISFLSCQNSNWIYIQLNPNLIVCVVSITKDLTVCTIRFIYMSV